MAKTKKRYQATDEQKAKAEARRAKFKELVKQVAEMTDEQRQELVNRIGAVPTCEGRALSFYNTCLLITQFPGVSLVGGFRQWLGQGRVVRKGETGLMIWFPQVSNRKQIAEGTADEADLHFYMGTVFDVSQTMELAADDDSVDEQLPTDAELANEIRQEAMAA
ncbi:MAG: ArdC-like ssDNA-binding domain-containing protein [Acidobacteria bacterium]|nr:ArdC-like ssDNA-binding domain-containing protein [Acidobacteriota bacterium]